MTLHASSWSNPSVAAAAALALCAACSSHSEAASADAGSGEAATPLVSTEDPFDVPIDGVTPDLLTTFNDGDNLFDLPLRDPDGLGPLYTRAACGDCHDSGVRGPGLVQKMSVMLADGLTPSPDQSKLAFGHTVHPLADAATGAKTPIVPPPGDSTIKVSIRVGPPVLGRGYMEAVLDSEIQRVATEQAARTDAIHGRTNMVVYASDQNPDTRFHNHQKGDVLIGRFGVKARIAVLDDFAADALQGDMGITSPLRPTEFPNPDGITDDLKPGIDETADGVNGRAMYTRLLAIPKRGSLVGAGSALFDQAKCSVCHVPSMKTRPDYPIALLAGIDAPIFTDLLLHDMGDGLTDGSADGIDGSAHAREWRTAPLIGLRFDKTYLHDGRALTLKDAILAHDSNGSTASDSVHSFQALSPSDQQVLLDFVGAL